MGGEIEELPHLRTERWGVCGWWFLKLKVPGSAFGSGVEPRRGRVGLCTCREVLGTPPSKALKEQREDRVLALWPRPWDCCLPEVGEILQMPS